MGLFKEWLLSEAVLSADAMSYQRDRTQEADVSKLIGFKKPLVKFEQGSFATLYQHPSNKNLLIKITSHKEDIKNIVKAQRLNSPNVVRAFPWSNGDLIKNLPTLDSLAIIVEKVHGNKMVYQTGEFFKLCLNGNFENASDWLLGTPTKEQKEVLDRHGRNELEEHYKLSELFKTIHQLRKLYRIELSDFQDNIMEMTDRYVIVDMGF